MTKIAAYFSSRTLAIERVLVSLAAAAAARAAVARGVPLVCYTAAGGARMQEGALSLMQMARTTLAIQELKAAQLPFEQD